LWYDGHQVGSLRFEGPLPFVVQHGGAGLCLGYDRGLPLCDDYEIPGRWTGGLDEVVIESGNPAPPPDVRSALRAD
jgi:arylsulfatase